MFRRIIKYIAAMLLAMTAVLAMKACPCYAASAEIAITADASGVSVGEKLNVYVTVSSNTEFGGVEANLTYDDKILEYVKGAPVIAGGSGYLKISDTGFSEGTKSKKYVLVFKARKTGTCKIARDDIAMIYDYANEADMSVSSTDLSVEVKAGASASDNASLKSLKISPSKLSPQFDKNNFEYSTKVSSDKEKLIVYAIPEDNKSKVSISGNDSLKAGENKVVVSVIAESGTVIKYTINVTREGKSEEIKQADTQEGTANSEKGHKLFKLVNIDGKVHVIYSGQYTLLEPDSKVAIPEGYIAQEAILSDITVNAYFPEKNMESEFFLLYAENELGEKGFYQYDRKEKTLQRFAGDPVSAANGEETKSLQTEGYQSNLNKAAIIIAVLGGLCALLVVVVIVIGLKLKNIMNNNG